MNTHQQFVNTLHTLIKDGDEVDRCYAIRSLATIKDQHSTEILIECLRDDDIDVCVDAAEALGKLGGTSAASMLLESLLNDPDGEVKTACIKALAELGDRDTIPHFIAMAEQRPENIGFDANEWDVWWDIQLESIKALGTLGVRESIPAFRKIFEQDDYLDIENELYRSLSQIGYEGDELLLSILESGSSRARRRVIKALGNSTSTATLKPLARGLQDADPDVRKATLENLPKRRHAIYYLPVILHLLKDSDAEVRRAAVSAVNILGQHSKSEQHAPAQMELVEKLLPLLLDPDSYVQSTVLNTLIQLEWTPDRKTEDQIIEMLATSTGDGFSAVCRFISIHQLKQALPDLLTLFKKRTLNNEEKARALSTLAALGQWDEKLEAMLRLQLFDDNKSVRLAALETLANLDKTLTGQVQNKIDTDNAQPVDLLIEALQGTLQVPAALRPIPVATMQAGQAEATASSPEMNPEETGPDDMGHDKTEQLATEPAAQTEDNDFVENAFQEISKSISSGEIPQPMSTLDSMAITCVEHQLKAAAELPAEKTQPEPGLSPAEKEELKEFLALSDANDETAKWLFSKEKVTLGVDIQRLAARMIGAAGSDKAIPSLIRVLEQSDDSKLQREIVLSLGQLIRNTETLPADQLAIILGDLSIALQAADRDLRIAAARIMGQLGSEDDIPNLIPGLEDSEVAMRMQCLTSIGALITGNKSTRELNYNDLAAQILAQFSNNEVGVNRAAIDALLPLLDSKLNGDTQSVKEAAIDNLIHAGLSGTDGQVRDMSQGLYALDQALSSTRLLAKLEQTPTSIERRYVVEMLGELHRPGVD